METKTPVLARKTVSQETCEILKDYMLGVVEEGSGKSAQVEGYAIGGKTGTAEKLPRSQGKNLNSFIGYAGKSGSYDIRCCGRAESGTAGGKLSGDKTFCGHYERSISIYEYYKIGINRITSQKD